MSVELFTYRICHKIVDGDFFENRYREIKKRGGWHGLLGSDKTNYYCMFNHGVGVYHGFHEQCG